MILDLFYCLFHSDRFAAVLTNNGHVPLCWECWLGPDEYHLQFHFTGTAYGGIRKHAATTIVPGRERSNRGETGLADEPDQDRD
jgi:hypothetical protein